MANAKKEVFTFKKNECYSLDEIAIVSQRIAHVSRKPKSLKECIKYGIHKSNVSGDDTDGWDGSMSDYDIFEKTVKITIEISN